MKKWIERRWLIDFESGFLNTEEQTWREDVENMNSDSSAEQTWSNRARLWLWYPTFWRSENKTGKGVKKKMFFENQVEGLK